MDANTMFKIIAEHFPSRKPDLFLTFYTCPYLSQKILPSVLEVRSVCYLSSPSKPEVLIRIEDGYNKTNSSRIKFLRVDQINHDTE